MGYQIKHLPKKKSKPNWKIQFVSYKKSNIKNFKTQNPRRTWDISQKKWAGLGFRASMTFEQAKERQRQLNAQLEIVHREEQQKRTESLFTLFEKQTKAFLPEAYKDEFERRYFFG